MRILVGVAAILVAGSAAAAPCDDADRGTYLSNVCFLVEEFTKRTHIPPDRIASVNEEKCTATFAKPQVGLATQTVYFNRADLREVQIYHMGNTMTCWRLNGEGVSGEGFGSNVAALCGKRFDPFRLKRAFFNLYTKYCKGKASEF